MPKKPKVSIKLTRKIWPPPPWVSKLTFALSSVIILILVLITAFHYLYIDKIYPGISIAGVDLGGLTKSQAKSKVDQILQNRTQNKLTFINQPSTNEASASTQQKIDVDLSSTSDFNLDFIVEQAFKFGHSQIYLKPENLWINSPQSLDQNIAQSSNLIDQPAIDSTLSISDNEIAVSPSQAGAGIDRSTLKSYLLTYINTGQLPTQKLPIQIIEPKLSYSSAIKIKARLDQIKLNPIKLTYQNQVFPLELKDVLPLVDLQNSQTSLLSGQLNNQQFTISSINFGNNQLADTRLSLNSDKTNAYIESIAQKIDQPVKEPLFNFDPSSPNRIKQFQPPVEGKALDRQKTYNLLSQTLTTDNQDTIALPVQVTEPQNSLSNDLGIKELIGHGESNFGGSIDNRIFNVKLAAARVNGVLVPPGETFSFDNTIGDVTAATGYKQAYVIKSGHTVLDDGGGVCQVSTTLFRAVLDSGLPVSDRTAHAYRVHYYENGGYPPGIDATTYYPSVDFKFKNDTSHYILVQAYYEGLNLFVDLYGTSDGRVATVTKPIISSQTPPPPDLRQDDPTLPKGTVKQVDFSAWGANVSFKRTVVKDGKTIINETYRSNYRPWQAVFLVGTKEG